MLEMIYLFFTFFKIGLFTFGGGYAMIPLIKQNILSNGWLTEQRLLDFIGISESTPGPFAVNIATFVGIEKCGIVGGVIATLGVILPSFIIILILAKFFINFQDNKYVKYGLNGLRPVIIGLILSAGISIFLTNIFDFDNIISFKQFLVNNINYIGIFIFGIIFFISKKFKLGPILIILISAVLGLAIYGIIDIIK